MMRKPPPPHIPGAPPLKNPKSIASSAKSRASSNAKMWLRRMIKIFLLIIIIAIVAGIVYYFKRSGPQPKNVVKEAIEFAFYKNDEAFKNLFTQDSIDILETAWADLDAKGSWDKMMTAMLTPEEQRPNILSEKINDKDGLQTAIVKIDNGSDKEHEIHLRKENNKWKININIAIDPKKIVFPPDAPPEMIDSVQTNENEAWWEEYNKKNDDKKQDKSKKSFFSKFKCSAGLL